MSTQRSLFRKAVSLALLLPLMGCVIVVDDKPEPLPVPTPVPQPVPVPGPGEGLVTTDQLWLVRVNPGLANLASLYEGMLVDFTAHLRQAGFTPGTVAVASLEDGRLLWASGPTTSPPASLTEVLQYHAVRASTVRTESCPSTVLATLGRILPGAQVLYPPDLTRDQPPLGSSRPFAAMGGALLVGILDSGAPLRAYGDAACRLEGRTPAEWFGGQDPAAWLGTADGHPRARVRTRFVLVGTAESVRGEEMRKACLAQSGFPPLALDSLVPSQVAFYLPWAEELHARADKLGSREDLCAALSDAWPERAARIADAWSQALQAEAGIQ